MGRTVLAVAAGFVLWTVLWLATNTILQNSLPQLYAPAGGATVGLLMLLLALSALYTISSAYLTAAIAPQEPERHALYLGGALLLVGIFVQAQNWYLAPLWYHLLFLGLLVPVAMLGGYLYAIRRPADDESEENEIDYRSRDF
jgi:hypothetical protein